MKNEMYQVLENKEFEGERSLYHEKNLKINNCKFNFGESPLKECKNIEVNNSTFTYKYPLWYSKNIIVNNTTFEELSRSGLWYSKNVVINDSLIKCPKLFRRCDGITINNSEFLDGKEMFWNSKNIKINNLKANGDYMFMNSKNIEIKDFVLDGNYSFDGASNIKIENATLNSKDSFWNSKNVVVKNSTIVGEYIGWNSKNLTFINCKIESLQGFCYIQNLKLIDCELVNTNLAFEYSSVHAKINSKIDSIKNPLKGKIEALEIGEIIIDENYKRKGRLKIIEKVIVNEKI